MRHGGARHYPGGVNQRDLAAKTARESIGRGFIAHRSIMSADYFAMW
jgi:hypothetical protein